MVPFCENNVMEGNMRFKKLSIRITVYIVLATTIGFLTQTILEDLAERQYFYNSKGQKQLEPKDNRSDTTKSCFKNRHNGRSPDEGDSLCLAFYEKRNDCCY
jgi:hypothetical protein